MQIKVMIAPSHLFKTKDDPGPRLSGSNRLGQRRKHWRKNRGRGREP